MKILRILTFSPLVLIVIFLIGCKKESTFGTLTLNLDHEIKGEVIELENVKYPCEAGHLYSVVNLRYYISNVTFHRTDGTSYSLDGVFYRDIHDPSTRSISLENFSDGSYSSLSFTFGLDETINVDGGLENTMTNINMEWPLPGDQGYHYMKFEGRYNYQETGLIKSYNLHTGPTGNNHNFFTVNLPFEEIKVYGDSWDICINMDVDEWLHHPNAYDFEEFGQGIMNKQDAQEILKENGSTAFRIASLEKE
ncbi:MAG: hypothetical protein GY705_27305 [Bacteroidetes bacterium]|nr:hypothetical protein [Bacteroidota bacterium]